MTSYTVQFVLPVENPAQNVCMKRSKGVMHFQVPINHPEAHSLSLQDLIAAAELSGQITLFTGPNKKKVL